MPRTFAYVRVSKMRQETENQIQEIESAGFAIESLILQRFCRQYGADILI